MENQSRKAGLPSAAAGDTTREAGFCGAFHTRYEHTSFHSTELWLQQVRLPSLDSVRREGKRQKWETRFSVGWLPSPICLISPVFSAAFGPTDFIQWGVILSLIFKSPQLKTTALIERANRDLLTQWHGQSCENEKPWWQRQRGWTLFCEVAQSERKPCLAFNQGENTNCTVLLEVQNSIISVRIEDSCKAEDGSERPVGTVWVAGPCICKVFKIS